MYVILNKDHGAADRSMIGQPQRLEDAALKHGRDVVVVAYGRSALARAFKGSFANTHPVEFGAQTLQGVLKKLPGLCQEDISDVIVGCAMPYGVQGYNIGKLILQRAGFPDIVTAQTINRFCSSGLQSIATAANAIACGEEEIIIAGGVESMSLVSMMPDDAYSDPWLKKNWPDAYIPMGITAENVAKEYNVSRSAMDDFAVESHRRAAHAKEAGYFVKQIVPVEVQNEAGQRILVIEDEGIRPGTNKERLAELKPAFMENGTVTAATSSQMTDGASFVVLMSGEAAKARDIKPVARFVSFSTAGVPAHLMGIGPIKAIPKVMKKTGLTLGQMDTIELNEAFASQAIACVRTLGMDEAKVNPWGGAIALGHPLGATGCVLTCKALSYLEQTGGRYGLVSMCIGGGMGAAGIFENLML